MSDEDEEPFVGGPPPDPSERTWRHPSELAAQANADAATAGGDASVSRATGPLHRAAAGLWPSGSRPLSLLLAGSLGAAACLTVVAITQLDGTDADGLGQAAAGGVVDISSVGPESTPDPNPVIGDGDAGASATSPSTTAAQARTIVPVSTTRPGAEVIRAAEDHVVGVIVGPAQVASGVMIGGYVLTSANAVGDHLSVQITQDVADQSSIAYLVGIDPFTDLAVYRPSLDARGVDAWARRLTLQVLDGQPSTDIEDLDTTWSSDPERAPAEAGLDGDVLVATRSAGGLTLDLGVVIGVEGQGETPRGQPIVGLIDTSVRRLDTEAGGLLVEPDGTMLGVVVDTSSSLASAVPLETALQIADRLTEQGWASETWIGFIGVDLRDGVEVVEVTPGGPAETAGLLSGDIIAFLSGARIEHMGGITAGLRRAEPGDVLILVVERDGEFVSLQVTAEPYGAETALSASVGG